MVVPDLVEAQLAAMRADPAEIQLHRTMRTLFLLVMRRPLARAFYTGDTELLELSEIVVTGTAGATERRAIGNAVTSVNAAEVTATQPVQITDTFQIRAPAGS